MARAKKFEKPPTPSYHPMATRSRVKANPAFQNLLSQFEKNDAAVKVGKYAALSVSSFADEERTEAAPSFPERITTYSSLAIAFYGTSA